MTVADLPRLPVAHDELINYIAHLPKTPMSELMDPYRKYEAQLREMYAQQRNNPVLDDSYINVLPLFTKDTPNIRTRARNLEAESPSEKEKYIMSLPDDKRRPNDSPAVVSSLKEFRHNFGVFSETSLVEMDWSNVVAAGSSVVNCLLPVPDQYKKSKRALRNYYHEKFSPASDVDLFLYGLNEEQAIEKIKEIEARIRDAILSEVTVVRTKNAITICSQYPTRHVQIVLRVYKSVSEILTGFDIDCSGAAYDGNQVYCTPRALASYITQINPIDLTRRSPSYENRLSKYSHRNFEVYWPELDRSRIDPTIFERSFHRTLGLARLLVLERLPTTNARGEYLKKRRQERGRPEAGNRFQYRLHGNIKDIHEDEVADWVDEGEVSNYHTFSVPYGEKFHAKKIEKLCYTKDLLLNAEWNQPKEREVYLHRHPAFFGRVDDVIGDCCGTCPKPQTPEEIEIAEKESEIYVSGKVSFRIDDPGRQQIGSFNPLTDDDWTEMAYVGNTARLCQAIVDGDVEHVEDWLSQEGADPNKRDYTGRTPLHLAVISSTSQVVQRLIDHDARLVARLADGRTALHLAAALGDIDMVMHLLERSDLNEEEEEERQDQRRKARFAADKSSQVDKPDKAPTSQSTDESDGEDSEADLLSDASSADGNDAISIATGSFVKVGKDGETEEKEAAILDEDLSEPDFYQVDAVAWDSKCSALHYAIIGGHCDIVELLCQEYGADVLSPVKIGDGSYSSPNMAILTMVLALALPVEKALPMVETLLSLGATSSQADTKGVTAFHQYIRSGPSKLVECLWDKDKIGFQAALNHVSVTGSCYNGNATTPLSTAIDRGDPILIHKLLEAGAKPQIDFDSWLKGAKFTFENELRDYENNVIRYKDATEQPLIVAIKSSHPSIAIELLEKGADPNTLTRASHNIIRNDWSRRYHKGRSALDVVHDLLKEYREFKDDLTGTPRPWRKPGFYAPKKGTYLECPVEPIGTTEFLSNFSEGTYEHWLVSTDIVEQIGGYKKQLERFEKERAESIGEGELTEKVEATQDLISQLERVLETLVSQGGKTFKEQYPGIPEPPFDINAKDSSKNRSLSPYTLEFKFTNVTDVTDARKDAYIKLFEAAWIGDLEVIKSLTLASWDADGQESPLKVAVSDIKGNNPFSLAFLRGHYEVSKAILEIAQAQWAPKSGQTTRFTMKKDDYDDGEYCSGGDEPDDSDEIGVYKKVINDQLTIDNIGQVSTQVKSQVLASALLDWMVPTFVVRDGSLEARQKESLLQFVISENDIKGFDFLINLHIHFAREEPIEDGEDESSRFYTLPQLYFDHALKLGRTEMLASVIRRVGAGIPIEDLVKKSGTKLNLKPRYYQGLSVYGKKRADWAKAGRNLVVKTTGSKIPPLLSAALQGSLESIEWFISDTPMRHYAEFGKSKVAQEDVRLKHLTEASGGFDQAISKWLGVQNDLAIHCAVMGPRGEKTNKLIEYLIKVCPSSFEAKSDEGYTPLYLACLLGRVEFAKTLINAGADQSVKDKELNNVIHAALTNNPKVEQLQQLLNLLDKDLRSHMFVQRNNLTRGGDTPLHFWLKEANPLRHSWKYVQGNSDSHLELQDENTANLKILQVLLELSGGAELETLNGAGDTILHTAVLRHLPSHIRVLLARNTNLLYHENAVGRTPSEVAYDIFISAKVEELEPVAVDVHYGNENIKTALKKKCASKDKEPEDSIGKCRKERTWRIIEEQLGKVEGKRRLVSLNEANDVAKRLGESYSWQRYFQKRTAVDEEQEEEQREKEEIKEVDFVTTEYKTCRSTAWKDD